MAIEASKFTEKDELIAKFYTMRAGLSAIAEETAKIKQAEQELSMLNAKNEEHNKTIQNTLISERKSLQENIDKTLQQRRSNHIRARIRKYQDELKEIENYKASVFIVILFAYFSILIFAGFCGLATVHDFGALGQIFIAAFGLCFAILWVITGVKLRRKITNRKINAKQAPILKKIEQENIELKKEEALEEQAIAALKSEISALELAAINKMDVYMGEINAFKTKLTAETIPICTTVAQSIKKAMLETSMGIITEVDWANIDLLIFYLETGRADSLKEALQLVDKQRQTDQITYAIHEASNHIVNTLGQRLSMLGSIIQTGFKNLATQIQFNHNEAMNTMLNSFSGLENTINAGNQAMSKKLGNIQASIKAEGDRLANAEHLNSSLLKKANESSDQLMYELRYNQKYWRN